MSRYHLKMELRRVVRAEIHRSPALLKEYRRRHRWDWVKRVGVCLLTPAMIFTALLMMPLSFTFTLQAPLLMRLVDLRDSPIARLVPDFGMLLAGQAMLVATIGSYALVHGCACFCQQKDLMAATYWPVSDRELNRRSHMSWLIGLLYLSYVLGMLTFNVVLATHPTPLQLAALIISVPLNAWHLMALVILWCSAVRTSHLPNPYWLTSAGICFILAMMSGVFALIPWKLNGGWSEVMLMSPAGWVNGAVRHLFFEPHPLVIGYIAVLIATWIYAANWLRQGFRVREILIGADAKVTPVFESGLPTPPEALRQLPESGSDGIATDSSAMPLRFPVMPPRTPEQLQTKAACLLWRSWDRCGWMERLIIRRMTKREQALVENFYHGHPHWGLFWAIGAVLTLASVAAVVIGFWLARSLGFEPSGNETVMPLFLMLWLLILLWAEIMSHQFPGGQMRQQMHTYGGTHPVFPVGWNDVLGIIRKTVWIRLAFLLPVALSVASLEWLFAPKLVMVTYVMACKGVFLVGLAIEAFGWMPFMATAMPSPYNWRRFMGLVSFAVLATVWIGAAALFVMPFALAAAPALAILLLCTVGIRMCARWVYHNSLDFPCRETVLPRGK